MGKRVLPSDEFELRSLRIQLLAVSEQITGQLARLAQRIGNAPPAAQASLLVLAGQIAATQQRLRDETDRLVGHPAERAAILRITLQAQFAVSSQLANILGTDQALSHLGTKLTNIAQELARLHRTEPKPIGDQTSQVEIERGEHDDLSRAEASGWPGHPFASLTQSEDEGRPRISEDSTTYATTFVKLGAGLSAVAAAVTFRSLAVTGCILCGLILAFAHFTSGGQHEVTMRSLPSSKQKIAAVPRVRPPLVRPQVSEARATYAQAILPEEKATHGRDTDASVTAAEPEPTPPSSTVNALVLKFAEQNAGPAPQTDNWEVSVASTRTLAASKPIPANASYVAVVSTHKEKDAAARAFAELQQRYPKLLQNRRSGLKEVTVGEKGVWYRVFILPPVTRQQATETCARLAAAGHDRCWVKEYHSD